MDENDAKRRGSSIGNSGSLSAPDLPAENSSATASKGMCLAALGIGVFGVVIGITGIVMANGASAELASLKQKVEQLQDPQTLLKDKFTEIDDHIAAAAADAVRANNGVTDLNGKITQLTSAIKQDREQINANTRALGIHRTSYSSKADAPAAKAADAPAVAAPTATVNAEGKKVHTIAKDDNFWSIAKTYGVTVQAIEAANPGVDSGHLKIGQEIVIPTESK
jgi:LysM repeat protein